MLDLALLPFLDGPSGLAHVVHDIAKIHQNAVIDSAVANGLFELKQLTAGFAKLEIHAPRFRSESKIDGHVKQAVFQGTSNAHNAGAMGFAADQVGELNLTAYAGERGHVQQTTVGIHLSSLCGLYDAFAVGVLPLGLYGNHDRKTAAAALFRSGVRRVGDHFVHRGGCRSG